MLRAFVELCQSVLSRDRIRVSPSEGRLLRLMPPCALAIGSETVLIVSRTVGETAEGPLVRYECQTESSGGESETDCGIRELTVRLTSGFRVEITWNGYGEPVSLAESDLVVFG